MTLDHTERFIATTVIPPSEPFYPYIRDPVSFCRDWLGVDTNYDKQIEMMEAVRDYQKVSIIAAPSTGKTWAMAEIALWFFYCFYPCKVITTSRTMRQVKDLLWGAIRSLHQRSAKIGKPLGGECLTTMLKHEDDPEWLMEGFSTRVDFRDNDAASSLTGYHAPNFLAIVDEAHGVDSVIIETMEDMLITGPNCKMVMVGNATVISGRFVDSEKDPKWKTIRLTAFDSINVKEKQIVIPGLVTYDWVVDKQEKWGEGHVMYDSKVLAQFPRYSEFCIIPINWIELAVERWKEWNANGRPLPDKYREKLGCDVMAGGADYMTMVWRIGNIVTDILRKRIEKVDNPTMQTAGLLKIEADRGVEVGYDPIGVGAGVGGRLQEQGVRATAVNFGEKTKNSDETGDLKFENVRAWCFWKLREAFDPNREDPMMIPPDDVLVGELASIMWKPRSTGVIKIEDKDDIKARLGRSPDSSDALAITEGIGITTPFMSNVQPRSDFMRPRGIQEQRQAGSPLAPAWGGFGAIKHLGRR